MTLIEQLYKELERLEHTLDFSVYYTFEESSFSTPGFDFNGYYYEIHKDERGELRPIYFGIGSNQNEEGTFLSDADIECLIDELQQVEALVSVPTAITVNRVDSKIDGDFLLWFEVSEGVFNFTEWCSNLQEYNGGITDKDELDSLINFYSREL